MTSNLALYLKEIPFNLKLAFPVILGMLGHTFVAFADNIMVGQLGPVELAAVSLGNSFLFIAMSLGIGLSTAITPLIAEADGNKKIFGVRKVLRHGVWICTIVGVLLSLIAIAASPLLNLMGQPEEVLVYAIPFLWVVAVSLIPMMIFQALKQLCDGLSRTRLPMYASIFGNLVNVLFNYLLIFGKFGFPEMGVIGAGIGTLISRVVMLILLVVLLRMDGFYKPYLDSLRWNWVSFRFAKRILSLGLPSALQVFFEVTLFTSAIWLSGILGTLEQAANQIALNLSSMTYMVGMGLSVAAMIRVGNQLGRRDYKRLKEVAQSIFVLTLLLQISFAILFLVFRFDLPHWYLDVNDAKNADDNLYVLGLASVLLLWSALFQISDGLQVVIIGALRGMQDVRVSAVVTFISYWIIGFPIAYYLGIKTDLGAEGIWIGLLAGLTASSLMLYIRFQYLVNHKITTHVTT